MKKAVLMLSDGIFFTGEAFGAETERIGEIVFNTSITGYQEILTDPSYKGQIVVMTYVEIGNYGISPEDMESAGGPKVEGFVVRENSRIVSNWRAKKTLEEFLVEYNIPGIHRIDTRALTRHLRIKGTQMGIISSIDTNPESLLKKVRSHPGISAIDFVKSVTSQKTYQWKEGLWKWPHPIKEGSAFKKRYHVVVYDFGVKFNILRNLYEAGFDVTVVSAFTPAEKVLEIKPDGILLSNGPGDPVTVTYAIENTKKLISKKPIFGICLGHQILGLAMGGKTYKLKFGHHGGNHPVKDLKTSRVEITAQNHNYCVDINSLKGKVRLTHQNLFDGSEEGMEHVEYPIFSIQHHPEAGPGPNDSTHLFERFRQLIETAH
ncbi:MAG: glutamine-hydrolyzing carbamoyl-phosphate synthase small subunit [Thermodesulfovibrionales bacterium]